MALLGNGLKTTLGGLAIGVGMAVVAPVIIPILASIAKPLTKAVIKEGLILYDKGRETVEEARETIDDLVAEVKSELETDMVLNAGAAAGAVQAPSGAAKRIKKAAKRK